MKTLNEVNDMPGLISRFEGIGPHYETHETHKTQDSDIEILEMKDLRWIVEDGDPTDEQISRYRELAEKHAPELLEVYTTYEHDSPPPEQRTRWEHEDRASDDLLKKLSYDNQDTEETTYYTIGMSVSFADHNFNWVRGISPFYTIPKAFQTPYGTPKKGYEEQYQQAEKNKKACNRQLYTYLKTCVDNKKWVKVQGIKKVRVLVNKRWVTTHRVQNHLQVWVAIPECKKKGLPPTCKYLTFFLFGEIVKDYQEAAIVHFKAERTRQPERTMKVSAARRIMAENIIREYWSFRTNQDRRNDIRKALTILA